MRHTKGTFVLRSETVKRLQTFSRTSGVSQSRLVDTIVAHGLEALERNWRAADAILEQSFGKALTGIAGKNGGALPESRKHRGLLRKGVRS